MTASGIALLLIAGAAVIHLLGSTESIRPSKILLASGVLYAIPFVATGADLVVRYDQGDPVVRRIEYTTAVVTAVVLVVVVLLLNAVTDDEPVAPVPVALAAAIARRLSILYISLLAFTAPALAALLGTAKGTRIGALPAGFVFLQLVGVALVGASLGAGRAAGTFPIAICSFATLLDLYLGYRIVVVLGAIGAALVRVAVGKRVARTVALLVVAGVLVGVVLKPVYYRLASGRPVSLGEAGTYVAEGLEGFETVVTATVTQASIDDTAFHSMRSSIDVLPVIVPFSGSVIGEAPSFAAEVTNVSFPDTPWGLGGSLPAELYLRDRWVGLIGGIAALIALSRWRPRSPRLHLIWLLSCPFAMFYAWRSDLALTLESTSKSLMIVAACAIGLGKLQAEDGGELRAAPAEPVTRHR